MGAVWHKLEGSVARTQAPNVASLSTGHDSVTAGSSGGGVAVTFDNRGSIVQVHDGQVLATGLVLADNIAGEWTAGVCGHIRHAPPEYSFG